MQLIAFVIFVIVLLVIAITTALYWLVWGPVLLVSSKAREARRRRMAARKVLRELETAMRGLNRQLTKGSR